MMAMTVLPDDGKRRVIQTGSRDAMQYNSRGGKMDKCGEAGSQRCRLAESQHAEDYQGLRSEHGRHVFKENQTSSLKFESKERDE